MLEKIRKTLIFLGLMAIIALPNLALAGDSMGLLNEAAGAAGYNTEDEIAQTGLARIVGIVARTFIVITGVIFISYTIYGGWAWMTAAGNEEKVKKAQTTIRDGIIGLIVIFASAAIYYFIFNALSNTTTTSQ
ncbi:MAG: hypothetical protein A2663_02910 [Candidatus Buchananbacteria bacterium RIFCSPHIGHO2_01_FULL_46_12]|uniref:Uncharacterized protein n=2 Tax=Candidatus Buchananiibacteriota TaxID=1817903 RepID=A0A1G1YKF0_9BACT|nr:MAG: hypothetical protein A2663_02910 [Candidatus Buchananbacteria bacterium RIFCSPHIGHO2_01_FULL_46_12]OGY52822.1 MAG: hypothetical protein A3B15_01600 [Candidatus Buchananbacteria bacterium RIFCSPLOWO2_01_FULL_45_31]